MRNERRFTLLEVVLAMAILALIATLTGSVLFSVQQSWSRIQENTDLLNTRIKLDRIANSVFRNAIPFHWPDDENKNRQVFRGRGDFVRMAYLHRINHEAETGIRFLELSLREDKLLARYRQYPLLPDSPEDIQEEVLADKIERLSFQYAIRSGNEVLWQDDFDEVAAENIPIAIRMTVDFADGNRVMYLRRTAGNSAVSNYGKNDEKPSR